MSVPRQSFFEDENGCPVQKFLENIKDEKLKVKTIKDILLLAKRGSDARMPLFRFIEDGIFELRTKQSSNITRIFYFFVIGNKIIMTNGYVKKTQEMDSDELIKAKKYMKKYFEKH